MADNTLLAQGVTQVDDRAGNHYWIFTVQHTTGENTLVEVDNSCIGATELRASGDSAATVTVADGTTTDGVKEITIDTGTATRTMTIIAQFTGSSSGSGSSRVSV